MVLFNESMANPHIFVVPSRLNGAESNFREALVRQDHANSFKNMVLILFLAINGLNHVLNPFIQS